MQGLAQRINAILAILKDNNIPKEDYETTSVNVFPNTTWNNGKSEIIGQIASQSLRIVIVNIGNDGQRISRLIDALATVNGIQINGISYDLADKTKAFAQARQAAYKNAQDKARDLTDALAISLGRL
ncbi:MAG: SIMPL domain-containing protein, partial [Flammeovirgaceae bacterium]